ncbi:MAG: glucose/arabinose dehydrogenase/mono/diheme cytochrome c family protein [Bacteroidia bacterium]|jgi:glucose/arabinose dehydrogenase/mono/diheme cytochrome c family protein
MKYILPVMILFSVVYYWLCDYGYFNANQVELKFESQYSRDAADIIDGEKLFVTHCSSCHSLQLDGMGPKLGGITALIDKKKLTEFVKNPSSVVESGDLRTNFLKERYNTVMPSFNFLEPSDMSNVLSYINYESELRGLKPLLIDTTKQFTKGDRVVAPIAHSGLVIELEDFIQIPLMKDRFHGKGVATLRADPSGNGSLFISDQMGIIYKVENGTALAYLNVRDSIEEFIFEPGLGTGLGSFDLHPDFLNNGLIYTTHAENYTGKAVINNYNYVDSVGVALQWVLLEWTPDEVSAQVFEGSKREVLRINAPTTAHGFQDIGFAPVKDKNDPDYAKLYIGIGDGGSINLKKPDLSHNIKSLLGTIIRIDPKGTNSSTANYGIPDDNPFTHHKDSEVKKEIWAYGFRNPHRMSWDMTNNRRLIAADIGESNVEEVNIIEKGGDYGWSTIEGNMGIDIFTDAKVVYKVSKDFLASYKLPFGQFDHMDGKAISGGFVYQGDLQELKDKYVFGDIVSGKLFYMNINESLSDSTIYDLTIIKNGIKSSIKEMSNIKRAHLRIGYDQYAGNLFVMTKEDGMVRRVTKAYYQNDLVQ